MSLDLTLIRQLEQALPAYIANRRWFRAKALTISEVHVTHIVEADGFLILVLTINYAEGDHAKGGSDLYLLPIASGTESQPEPIATFDTPEGKSIVVSEAIFSPFFRTMLFRALTTARKFETEGVVLTAKSTLTLPPIEGILESSVSGAEQSNTSLIYGRDYILKLFRKLEPGINPDIEMGAFLTAQGFAHTPAVLATLELQNHRGERFSAGILQRFVPNQGDAWGYTLKSLVSFYQRGEILDGYLDSAKLLGVRTAQMHSALASAAAHPDFAPEPFTAADAQLLSLEITAQTQTSLDLLRNKLASLAPAEQELAQRVIHLEAKILSRFSALAAITTSAKRIRYHGDYHLGQVLYTGTDFMIIDFEGEPARPLNERRAKALALRDAAGMLRSFQYAAYSGNRATPSLSSSWYAQVSKHFLDAYFEEAEAQPFLPSTPEQREFFLNVFLLQKALYEAQYELNNRPTWVGIPLRGILSLVE